MAGWLFDKQFSDNNPPKRLIVESVLFKRSKDGEVERGLMINDDEDILDMDGKHVKTVWDYKLDHGTRLIFREED